MATISVSDSSFESDVLGADKPVLVDFWAEWCGPCKMIAPAIDEISDELADTLIVAKLDIDENTDVPVKYGVRGIPTLMLFKDGEAVDQKVGAHPKTSLVDWIKTSI